MRKHKKLILLTLAVLAATVVAAATLHSQAQDNQKKSKVVELRSQKQLGQQDVEVEQLPVADYNAPKSTNPKRKAKSERYKKKLPMAIDPNGENLPVMSTAHWWTGLSALPADKSDAVVIGEVKDAQAFLSDDNTGLYSEFTVRINEVLKDDASNPLANSLVAERLGGAIKFPNGRVKAFRYNGQGFPHVKRQYVFFLQRNSDGQDYTIVTGYELRGGHVVPLDGAGTKLRFSVYNGADETAFLSDVRNAIAQTPQASLK